MRKISLFCLLLMLLAIAVGGCSENQEVSDVSNEPTEAAPVEIAPTSTSADPDVSDTETADDEGSEEDPVAMVEEVDYCVECHSNQTMLTQTAAPVIEVESENEGEG